MERDIGMTGVICNARNRQQVNANLALTVEAQEGNNFLVIILHKMFIAHVRQLGLPQLEEEYPYDSLTDEKGNVVVTRLFLELSRLYTGEDQDDIINRMEDYFSSNDEEVESELEEEWIERALRHREHDIRERRRLALQNIRDIIKEDITKRRGLWDTLRKQGDKRRQPEHRGN